MKDNSKKIGAFVALGIMAVGAIVAVKEPGVHRYIDEKLYQYGKTTFFQPIEDYRFNVLIDYVSKHSSLNDIVTFDNIVEYKESLKDADVFEGELAAMREYVKDNQTEYEHIQKNSSNTNATAEGIEDGEMYRNIPSENGTTEPFNGNGVIGKIYKIRNGLEPSEIPPSPKSRFI